MESNNLASKIISIISISSILGIIFNYFFYQKIPGISFLIYVVLNILGLFIVSYFSKKKINKQVIWLLIPLIFFSTMVFIRASTLLTFLNMLASLILLLIIAEISLNNNIKDFCIMDYLKILFLPLQFIHPFLETISNFFSLQNTQNENKKTTHVIKGVIIAIPILFTFLILFSSADLIFKKYISSLININSGPELIFKFILIIIVAVIYIGVYSYIFQDKKERQEPKLKNQNNNISTIESYIILGSINILFLLFIIIQITYLFGGESNISMQGFTYAEYARKGFFELILVAILSFIILLSTEKYIKRKTSAYSLTFKILSTALVIQVVVIMISAFTRLSLYEEAYGFTTLRLYSHAFIILLTVIFLLLLYKIYKNKQENTFAFNVLLSTIIFLITMNILNPDVFIANKNIERFNNTGKLDSYYLGSLSSDAIAETSKMLNILNDDLKAPLAYKLYWLNNNLNSAHYSKWQSYNISRIEAKNILSSNISELEKYKEIIK